MVNLFSNSFHNFVAILWNFSCNFVVIFLLTANVVGGSFCDNCFYSFTWPFYGNFQFFCIVFVVNVFYLFPMLALQITCENNKWQQWDYSAAQLFDTNRLFSQGEVKNMQQETDERNWSVKHIKWSIKQTRQQSVHTQLFGIVAVWIRSDYSHFHWEEFFKHRPEDQSDPDVSELSSCRLD